MKKRFKGRLQVVFWTLFVAGCLWLGFAPHAHHVPPGAVPYTVKVQQAPVPSASTATESDPSSVEPEAIDADHANKGGEETASPALPSPDAGITIPVPPEKEEPLPPDAKPRIALVIDDVGVDYKDSARAVKLPPAVTLSFLPYAVRLRDQSKEARDAGHELLLHMPMEPLGKEDPGPGALLVDLPMRDLQQRFENALASFVGFDGVNNHMGSKFTAYGDGMSMVIDELVQRHLFFLDSRTNPQSVGLSIAEEKGLPTIGRDVFLDDDPSPAAIRKQLEATEKTARRKGYAVAIGHPHPATLDVLQQWIPEAQKRGLVLVPLKALVKKPGG